MKIFIPNDSSQKIGGGWTFIDNFKKAVGSKHIARYYKPADIFFIAGASMVDRETFNQAKRDGKKIVLRVDNALRNSRNRNTGMSRMYDYAQEADLVIYQSEWAERVIGHNFLDRSGRVIINSADESVYNNKYYSPRRPYSYLYSRYSRDETKNWEMARFAFQQVYASKPEASLNIVGNFSDDLRRYNFDFYQNENYRYCGVVTRPVDMANYYKMSEYFLFTYFNDACSNTLIEALLCGCKLYDPYNMADTGGSREIVDKFNQDPSYFWLERMGKEYLETFRELV